MKLLFSGFLFFLLIVNTFAFEKPNLKFERLSIDQGLSQGNINTIIQDKNGFMWFGTQDGLNRFDGYEFVIYKPDPENPRSISSNVIKALYETKDGRILVGTAGGGLNIYNPNTDDFTVYMNNASDLSSLSNNSVYSVYEDKDSIIWVGTFGGGVCVFNAKTNSFTRYQYNAKDQYSLSGNAIRALFEDQAGDLWVGVDGAGLNKFDPIKKRFMRFMNDPADPESLASDIVLTVMVDREGYFWVGSWAGGISKFNPRTGKCVRYKKDPENNRTINSNETFAFCQDRDGRIWVSTRYGLDIIDQATGYFYHYLNDPLIETTLSHNVVIALYEDNSGVFWVGTEGGGINKVDLQKKKFKHIQHDYKNSNTLSNNEVTCIYEDSKGLFWIGTRNGGVNVVNFEKDKYDFYSIEQGGLSSNFVNCVIEDINGHYWLGTNGAGLNKLNRETGKITLYQENRDNPDAMQNNAVFALVEDRFGEIWLGTYGGGIEKYIPSEDRFKTYVIDANDQMSNVVLSVVEDGNGTIYGGTYGHGLIEYDREKDKFIFYETTSEGGSTISSNTISCLFIGKDGILWIGTGGAGLDKFDRKSKTFTNYNVKNNNLVSDNISGIQEDSKGNLWVTTVNGMSRFNKDEETFRNYDKLDGLQDNAFIANSMWTDSKGYIYFGGGEGMNIFYPDSIVDDTTLAQIAITDFKIFNESVIPEPNGTLEKTIGQTNIIELSYRQKNFSFEFSSLHYASPSKNQYKYMMEGFDADWYEASPDRRFASYTNLPGGEYTFRVIGSNNDHIWNNDGASIKIIVHPPFYKTWWFYTLLAIVLGTVLFIFFKYKEKQNLLHKQALQKQINDAIGEVEKQKKEIVEQNKELYIRQEEDKKRQWFNEGIALFAEIMRKNKDDLNKLSAETLSQLIRYMGASQGALFVLNEEDLENKFLQLISSYGYSQEAVDKDIVEIGEGLVGNCFVEKSTKILTDLPEGYLTIESSLGSTKPKSLVLIPLKMDELIFGVMEISSLKLFSDFEIEFLEKLAESITSQLFTTRISMKTADLLAQSQQQAEELRAQEEEARQNIEEMQANREEAIRLRSEALGFINSMNHSIIRADFQLNGMLSYANTRFLDYFGYKSKEARQMHVTDFFRDNERDTFKKRWDALLEGSKHIEEKYTHKTKDGVVNLLSTYTIVKDINGEQQSVLYLGLDVSDSSNATASANYELMLDRLNSVFISYTIAPDGTITSVNKKYETLYGFKSEDVLDVNIKSFIQEDHLGDFEKDWQRCLDGEIVERISFRKNSEGKELTLCEYYMPVMFDGEEISEIIVYANNISDLSNH